MSDAAPLLRGTCAAIWTTHDQPIHASTEAHLNAAIGSKDSIYVSPITAWEAGLLTARGRAALASGPKQWFSNLLAVPRMVPAKMAPDHLIESSMLPGAPPKDPADRIIIATTREYGLCILTRDRKILDYADKGLVMAMAC